MTKAELIRKIAKRSGVPDSEAKYFFELFLKKLALQLKPGESVRLKSIGFFQLRTGRIKNEDIHSELMVFYPAENLQEETAENMIFNIPLLDEPKFNPVDTLFSLSFGRPVIPLQNTSTSEYFIPPTGAELKKLSENKAEKLLREIELVENFSKGNEELILNPDANPDNQMEIDWENIQVISGNIPEKVSWNFGNLDKEIEEESLLDTGNEDNLIQSYEQLEKESLNWDFGESVSVESDEKKPNFEVIEPFSSEMKIEEDDDWKLKDEKLLEQIITDEMNEDGFAEIKVKQRFPFVTDYSEYEENKDDVIKQQPEETSAEAVSEVKEAEPVIAEEPERLSDTSFEDELLNSISADTELKYSKIKGLGFYILFAVLFLFAAGFWGYTKIFKKPAEKKTVVEYIIPKTAPADVIVERSYDLPVSYPYTNENTGTPFNPYNLPDEKTKSETKEINQNLSAEKEQSNTPSVKTFKENQPDKLFSESSQKVKEFFFKQGDKYIVQISAWQKKQRAEKHAEFLNAQGYQTEVQDVNISGQTWYRVRVGYFNSLEEAEKFYNKYR